MYIENVSLGQTIIAISFVAALILLQIYIKRNKSKLKSKWSSGRRIEIAETTRLGPTEKVQIISIDKKDYLYFFAKGNQPVIIPVNDRPLETYKKNNPSQNVRAPIINTKNAAQKSRHSKKDASSQKETTTMMQAISAARKLNPKVSFE